MKPLIGLMLGDVTGIGPELVVKLLSTPAARERADVVIIGDERVLELGMRDADLRIPRSPRTRNAAYPYWLPGQTARSLRS